MSRPPIPPVFSEAQTTAPNQEITQSDFLSPEPRRTRGPPPPLRPSYSTRSRSAQVLLDLPHGDTSNPSSRRGTVSAVPPQPGIPEHTQDSAVTSVLQELKSPQTSGYRRSRAHTVSVCLPSARDGNDSRPKTGDVEMALGRRSPSSGRRGSVVSQASRGDPEVEDHNGELHDEVVGMLDVVDPQVSTVNSLQNMTNSILIPHFPSLWSRRPEIVLPETPSDTSLPDTDDDTTPITGRRRSDSRARSTTLSRIFRSPSVSQPSTAQNDALARAESRPTSPGLSVSAQNDVALSQDIEELEKFHELDRHVKHVLRKRDKARRVLKGVWQFVKTPMGAITAIYGFLVAFWGAAIVLFLLGWINAGSKEWNDIWVEISSQVENGLFTITGVGLIPWRVKDTYRMYIIWKLKRLTVKLRTERGLPPIEDPDDLPDPKLIPDYVYVLTDEQQEQLRYQQEKFSASQTWYKPHATATHRAFPISWALWNTVLMDGNSFFQCILCGTMWGLNRHQRPAWTTGCLIPLSFLCGIGAAVLIWRGGVRTKKRETVEDKLRQALGVPLAIALSGQDEKSPNSQRSTSIENKRRSTISAIPSALSAMDNKAMSPTGRRSTVSAPGDHHLDIPLTTSVPRNGGGLGKVTESDFDEEGEGKGEMQSVKETETSASSEGNPDLGRVI